LSLAVWVRLSRTYGKLRPLTLGAAATGFSTSLLYLLLPAGNFVLPLILGGVGIGALVGCIVLIDSMLTDVIDYDEWKSGEQRAGLYFGCWRFAAKLARAVALLTTGLVLEAVDFESDQPPDEKVRWALRLLFGPGVGLFFLFSGLILVRYRFDHHKQRQLHRLLTRKRARTREQKNHSAA
jgi:GPH family glycoside/pentoside/hexuronide:cation symporter